MIIYTYKCLKCEETFEIEKEEEKKCLKCGSHFIQRIFTPLTMVLKGSGFYTTDNKK